MKSYHVYRILRDGPMLIKKFEGKYAKQEAYKYLNMFWPPYDYYISEVSTEKING